MREYLASDEYCDWGHPAIRSVAGRAREINGTERETAVWLFEFVRDEVKYEFGSWSAPASQTLDRRGGMCTTKANLLVALFRASGIPAAYGTLRVDGAAYFGAIVPATVRMGNEQSTHVYAGAWLDGRWVRCDPSTDRLLSEKSAHFCHQTTLAVWDGVTDRMDYIDPQHVHQDLGLTPDLRHLTVKQPSERATLRHDLYNYYLDFLRAQPQFESADDVALAMFRAARRDPEIRDRLFDVYPKLAKMSGARFGRSDAESAPKGSAE